MSVDDVALLCLRPSGGDSRRIRSCSFETSAYSKGCIWVSECHLAAWSYCPTATLLFRISICENKVFKFEVYVGQTNCMITCCCLKVSSICPTGKPITWMCMRGYVCTGRMYIPIICKAWGSSSVHTSTNSDNLFIGKTDSSPFAKSWKFSRITAVKSCIITYVPKSCHTTSAIFVYVCVYVCVGMHAELWSLHFVAHARHTHTATVRHRHENVCKRAFGVLKSRFFFHRYMLS